MQQDEDEMARPIAAETDMPLRIQLKGLVSAENLEQVFSYHAPRNGREIVAYAEIRARAMDLAETILRLTPACGNQQAALRKVREAMMTANAAIATEGAV